MRTRHTFIYLLETQLLLKYISGDNYSMRVRFFPFDTLRVEDEKRKMILRSEQRENLAFDDIIVFFIFC